MSQIVAVGGDVMDETTKLVLVATALEPRFIDPESLAVHMSSPQLTGAQLRAPAVRSKTVQGAIGSFHVLFDPLFKQIGDLLVVEFCHHRVTVTENPHLR